MGKASDLPALSVAYFVGQQRPLHTLPLWKRTVIRAAFWLTSWCGGVEGQAICTDGELAKEMCKGKPNWFSQPLPVNVSLPEAQVQFQGHSFPASDSPERYKSLNLPLIAVPKKVVERDIAAARAVEEKVAELSDCLEGRCARTA